ncbi:YbhB/YbcL family Raf kinase inhibitor-like protein [Pseudomonas sp. Marseille-QA0332]
MRPALPSCFAALTLTAAFTAAQAAPLSISSESFQDNAFIGLDLVGKDPSCGAGKEWSPHVRWSGLPQGTRSIALVMFDPDGAKGLGVVHWVAYNIDVRRGSVNAGAARFQSHSMTVGRNSSGAETYKGPCPPAGDNPHHYVLTLIASDLPPAQLPSGLDRAGLLEALQGHALGAQSIVGLYGH